MTDDFQSHNISLMVETQTNKKDDTKITLFSKCEAAKMV